MEVRTITISRALGAGGEEVGLSVADSLGFRYVDDEIVRKAAEAAGVSTETVARSEATPPLIRRILEVMAAAPAVEAGAWTPEFAYEVAPLSFYGELIRQVIFETANEGKAIILAHGASMALAGTEGVLRVLITASPEVRARRVAAATKVDEAKAKKIVEDSDRQRKQYFKRFYGLSQELPTHYDLVINTDTLTPDQAAQLLVVATKS